MSHANPIASFPFSSTSRVNQLTGKIIAASIKIYRQLGPGLLESANEACVSYELSELGLRLERQKAVPPIYQQESWIAASEPT